MMDTLTSLSAKTLTRSLSSPTSSSTHHILTRSLSCSLAGSTTCLPAPLPLIMPCTRPHLTSMTGTWSLRSSNTTTMMTTTNTFPTSSTRSRPSSPLLRMPLSPSTTSWKQHKFLLSFLTSGDVPSLMPSKDIALLNHVATSAATMMDQELHSRMEGDVITSYRRFNARVVGGKKRKSPEDWSLYCFIYLLSVLYCLVPYNREYWLHLLYCLISSLSCLLLYLSTVLPCTRVL